MSVSFRSAASVSAVSSRFAPGTRTTSAPVSRIAATFTGGAASGTTTTQGTPSRAAT
nr:hypothetical protein [Stackebrandtia nassauensis]